MTNEEKLETIRDCKVSAQSIVSRMERAFGTLEPWEATSHATQTFDDLCRMERLLGERVGGE